MNHEKDELKQDASTEQNASTAAETTATETGTETVEQTAGPSQEGEEVEGTEKTTSDEE